MTTLPALYMGQNYPPECEVAINDQIILELYASYVYESMACYFNSHEVALKQFAQFFLQQSGKERVHAHRLIALQNQRGGHLRRRKFNRPDPNCWKNGLKALESALHLEQCVNRSLLDLHQLATEKNDAHLCDFLKGDYLQEQVKFLKELEDHITNLTQMGALESGLAEDLFDKLTLGDSEEKN